MVNTPYDLVGHIRTTNTAICSRCGAVKEIDGERSRYTVAEYLIRQGWSASDDEIVCGSCAQCVTEAADVHNER